MRRVDWAHRKADRLRCRVLRLAFASGFAGATALAGLAGFVGLSGLASPSSAAVYTESEVRTAVETWVHHTTADARADAVIERMEPIEDQGETLVWIAHLQGGGFCIAGADPVVLPVYLYAPTGSCRLEDPSIRAIVDEVIDRSHWGRTELERSTDLSLRGELAGRSGLWTDLLAGRSPFRRSVPPGTSGGASGDTSDADKAAPTMLQLPATAAWNQPEPYFNQLPVLTPSSEEHTLVGCNAVATAQIMYWWKWPWTGVGSASLNYYTRWRADWDSEPLNFNPGSLTDLGGRLIWDSTTQQLKMRGHWDASLLAVAIGVSVNTIYQAAVQALYDRLTPATIPVSTNFAGAYYDWSQIQDRHFAPYMSEDFEVAELCRDVAIACNSLLGVRDTKSFFGNDVAGLKNHLRYDTDAVYDTSASREALTTEIEWGRLAGLGGSHPWRGGHAWIVEGYDKSTDPNRLFYMNLGWGGDDNGWYTFDSAPFPNHHDMMTRIAPAGVVRFVGSSVAGDGSPAQPYQNLASALASAPDHSVLHFRAGSNNGWTGTINRPLVLKGYGAVIH